MDSLGIFGAFSHAYHNSDSNYFAIRVLSGLSASLQTASACIWGGYKVDISDYQTIILKNEHPDSYFAMEFADIEARRARLCEYDTYTPRIPRKISFTGECKTFQDELKRLSSAADQKISQEVLNDTRRQSTYMTQLDEARDKLRLIDQKSRELHEKQGTHSQPGQFAKALLTKSFFILQASWPQEIKQLMSEQHPNTSSHVWFNTVTDNQDRTRYLGITPLLCELIDRTTFAAHNFLKKTPEQRQADVERLSQTIQNKHLADRGVIDRALTQNDPASLIELSAAVAFAEVLNEVKRAYQTCGGSQQDNPITIFQFFKYWLIMNKPQWQ